MSMGMEWEWEERRLGSRFAFSYVLSLDTISARRRSVRWAASPLSLSPTDLLVPKANAQGVHDVHVDQTRAPFLRKYRRLCAQPSQGCISSSL